MKTHYCPADHAVISYEGKCNWCGEKEHDDERRIQEVSAGVLESTPIPEADEDISIPVAPI